MKIIGFKQGFSLKNISMKLTTLKNRFRFATRQGLASFQAHRASHLGKPEKMGSVQESLGSVLASAAIIPATGYLAWYHYFIEGKPVLALVPLGGMGGATVRMIRGIDNRATAGHIAGKNSRMGKWWYHALNNTPLRLYTLNQIDMKLEKAGYAARLKNVQAVQRMQAETLRKQGLDTSGDALAEGMKHERTYQYLANKADHKKHLSRIMFVVLAVFGAMRMMAAMSDGRAFTTTQIISRVGGYIYGLGYSVAHVDAYVRRRARMENQPAFFDVSKKVFDVLPTKWWGRWLIKRDLQNYKDLVDGRQPLRRRVFKGFLRGLPLKGIRQWALKRHERGDYILTAETNERLREDGHLKKFEDLQAILSEQRAAEKKAGSPSARAAWREYVVKCAEIEGSIKPAFEAYKGKIDGANLLLAHFENALTAYDLDTRLSRYAKGPLNGGDDRYRASNEAQLSAGSLFRPARESLLLSRLVASS